MSSAAIEPAAFRSLDVGPVDLDPVRLELLRPAVDIGARGGRHSDMMDAQLFLLAGSGNDVFPTTNQNRSSILADFQFLFSGINIGTTLRNGYFFIEPISYKIIMSASIALNSKAFNSVQVLYCLFLIALHSIKELAVVLQ